MDNGSGKFDFGRACKAILLIAVLSLILRSLSVATWFVVLGPLLLGLIYYFDIITRIFLNTEEDSYDESANEPLDEDETAESVAIEEKPCECSENETPLELPSVRDYIAPPLELLLKSREKHSFEELREDCKKIEDLFSIRQIDAKVVNAERKITADLFYISLPKGKSVKQIKDAKAELEVCLDKDVEIQIPVPNTEYIGLYVKRNEEVKVFLRDLLEGYNHKPLSFALGRDLKDEIVFENLDDVCNLLVCGATGTGRSFFLQNVLTSFAYTSKPDDLRTIIFDFSSLDFNAFCRFPFLLTDIINTPQAALDVLKWLDNEAQERSFCFSKDFPHIVIFINDMAVLDEVVRQEFERLFLDRAIRDKHSKIHFFAACSLPYAEKISPLRGNFSSKICFFVPNSYNSVSIIGESGAEKLSGDSEFIYKKDKAGKTTVRATYVSYREYDDVNEYLKMKNEYHGVPHTRMRKEEISDKYDKKELFCTVGRFVTKNDVTSIGMIQRKFKLGFNSAARIMDELCDAEVVSKDYETGYRKVLMSEEEFEEYIARML